jgi:hypothetical protein
MNPRSLKQKWYAVATALGMTSRGVFVPHRYARSLLPDMQVPELEPLFRAAEPGMVDLLAEMAQYEERWQGFTGANPPDPRWEQSWFPGLDGAAAYTLVRKHRPRRILEIGSGHSTRFMARAILDGDLQTELICIDPAPRASIAALKAQFFSRTLQDMELSSLPELAAGDVLFIDSSHLALPGSDVDLIFSRLLPRLPAGVLVHIHDILLPDAYPEAWRWRVYGEHLPVASWLAAGGLRPIFSSSWTRTRLAPALPPAVAAIPLQPDAIETSLWTIKLTPPNSTQPNSTLPNSTLPITEN